MDDPSTRTHSQFRTLNYFSLDGAIPKDAIRCAEHSDWGMIRDVHCQCHGRKCQCHVNLSCHKCPFLKIVINDMTN